MLPDMAHRWTVCTLAATALVLGTPAHGAGKGPRDVALEFTRALHRGDVRRAAALAHGAAPRRTLSAFVRLAGAYESLEKAVASRFGHEGAARVGYRAKVRAEEIAYLTAEEAVEGDRAAVTSAAGGTLAVLRRVRGSWRVELGEAVASPGGVEQMEIAATVAAEAADRVARRLRAGRYGTVEAALDEFRASLAKGMEQAPKPGEISL